MAGKHFTSQAVGHLGFTGCSIWIEPEKELDVVLLTNRVHPSPDNTLIKEFRPRIHDLVLGTLGFVAALALTVNRLHERVTPGSHAT